MARMRLLFVCTKVDHVMGVLGGEGFGNLRIKDVRSGDYVIDLIRP